MAQNRILVIDDSTTNNVLFKSILEEEHFQVFFVENGGSGLKLIKKIKPDLVLLDLNIPDMSGFDILRNLKSDFDLQYIPVIIVSARDDIESKNKALKLGAKSYCSKPLDVMNLMKSIYDVLGKN